MSEAGETAGRPGYCAACGRAVEQFGMPPGARYCGYCDIPPPPPPPPAGPRAHVPRARSVRVNVSLTLGEAGWLRSVQQAWAAASPHRVVSRSYVLRMLLVAEAERLGMVSLLDEVEWPPPAPRGVSPRGIYQKVKVVGERETMMEKKFTVQGTDPVAALIDLFDAVPPTKRRRLFQEMAAVETVVRAAARGLPLLAAIRSYLLDPETLGGGGDSPFVREIDKILPR